MQDTVELLVQLYAEKFNRIMACSTICRRVIVTSTLMLTHVHDTPIIASIHEIKYETFLEILMH